MILCVQICAAGSPEVVILRQSGDFGASWRPKIRGDYFCHQNSGDF